MGCLLFLPVHHLKGFWLKGIFLLLDILKFHHALEVVLAQKLQKLADSLTRLILGSRKVDIINSLGEDSQS
ncbi:hypothetical protein RIR_jg29577.t1 [Rhizophagus irregularis DAOM 181602=DAOM 197198]|nr:hypothetical protein RIR_jg29577.t1 [Rhizophagus irregularis DAOM 181602=DAOM 197198]